MQLADIGINGPVYDYMHYLGSAASPLSLMSVGAGLILTMNRSYLFAISYAVCLKLILLPLITFCLLLTFDITGTYASIALLYSCVPCAGNAYILSRQMGGDSHAMAAIITWGTLISVLSIPMIMGFWIV
ncbi:AEC family transporter [Thorsellia kenyensis]|uniref:AEC family transporter n=1 Tax=Thorsellia kenyensis TaxID=1549888 RepID=A0ABV6C7V4_9GAMM